MRRANDECEPEATASTSTGSAPKTRAGHGDKNGNANGDSEKLVKDTGGDADKDVKDKPKRSMCRKVIRRILRRWVTFCGRFIDIGARCFSVGMKILGPCLVVLANCLIGFVTWTYFTCVLPLLEVNLVAKILITIVGVFLLANVLYNYAKSIFMSPGTPPEFAKVEMVLRAEAEENGEPVPKQCRKCTSYKPVRAHHCSVCGRCVMKMDHHCPWVNNCVGHRNYRHFCLFMLFLAMCCTYVLLIFLPFFMDSVTLPSRKRRGDRNSRQYIMTSFMIAVSILVALCILGGFHVYLVLTNQTTIEFQTNLMDRREARRNGELFRNQYDMGRRRNFQQVFGPTPFCRFLWLLSWLAPPATGDGMQFPSLSRLRG